jgi:hypothetical protein
MKYELCFYIPEDGILHGHRIENLKPYNVVLGRGHRAPHRAVTNVEGPMAKQPLKLLPESRP